MENLPGLRRLGVGDEYRAAARPWWLAAGTLPTPLRKCSVAGHSQAASAAAARRTTAQPSAPGASDRGAEPRTASSGRGLSCRPAAAAAC